MDIKWNRKERYMTVGGRNLRCSCVVRTMADGTRKPEEVVRTMPNGLPYQPARFPVGTWTVLRPRARTDPYRRPFFIPTDAWQEVQVWKVAAGKYTEPDTRTDKDRDYGIHFSESRTTHGCVRIDTEAGLRWLVDEINKALDAFEPVRFIVTE